MLYNVENYKSKISSHSLNPGETLIFPPNLEKVQRFMLAPCDVEITNEQLENFDGKTFIAKSRRYENLDDVTQFIETYYKDDDFAYYMVIERTAINIISGEPIVWYIFRFAEKELVN